MHDDQPVVMKIGGSLIEHAREIIRTIGESRREVLIIPGGGIFADAVRERGVFDTAAHFMAIAAMDQYGWLLSTYGIPVSTEPIRKGSTHILLPYTHLLKTDPLPHSWDITSDTISAYYASLLSLPLIILKSIDNIRTLEGPVERLQSGMISDDIDPAFIPYISAHEISGLIIRGSDPARIAAALRGDEVLGTRFGSTI